MLKTWALVPTCLPLVRTYSDLLPAEHWEHDTVARRRERWKDQLSGEASGHPLVAIVEQDVVGFARAGAARGKDGVPPVRADELWALYIQGWSVLGR